MQANINRTYIWLDAENNIRWKSKIESPSVKITPWSFDGSSTGQSQTNFSDLILEPVAVFTKNINNQFLQEQIVVCEIDTFNMASKEIEFYSANYRSKLLDLTEQNPDWLISIEQEYFLFDIKNSNDYNDPSYQTSLQKYPGEYYCGKNYENKILGYIVKTHQIECLQFGINYGGLNKEVAPYQWEFQISPGDPVKTSDHLIVARFLLERIAEENGMRVCIHPKPFLGNIINGSGAHINFSNDSMRNGLTTADMEKITKKLSKTHHEAINGEVYGKDNNQRLTGHNETSNPSEISCGVANRTCSIRMPLNVFINGKGYLEDRRPGANINPYQALFFLINSLTC